MRHLQLFRGCSQKTFWGISAEATTYAPGGPTNTRDELESVKRAKKQGPNAI